MIIIITVRFSDTGAGSGELGDLDIKVSYNPNKDDFNKLVNTSFCKMRIRQKIASTHNKRLRLIYNGRVLNDQSNFSADILKPKLQQLQNLQESTEQIRIYIHCLIGENLTPQQLENERELDRIAQEESTEAPVIGFDRLLLQGVSAIDVDNLRRQFYLIHFPELNSQPTPNGVTDIEEDENRQEYVRQLEERWLESTVAGTQGNDGRGIDSGGNEDRAQANLEGTIHNEDLLIGLLLGTFLGVVALVFLMMDDSMFNNTQKMAIILGVMTNLFLAFLRIGSVYSV